MQGHASDRSQPPSPSPLDRFRISLVEFSGGFGDIGTFIPLAVGLSVATGMDFGIILIFAGAANIFAGVLFGLPVPVQPMKVIAAVAIADALSPGAVAAAGIATGAVVLVVGLSRLIEAIEKAVPMSVVRGIQLGVAVKLFIRAASYIRSTPYVGFDSIVTAASLALLVIATRRFSRFPSAFALFIVGLLISFPTARPALEAAGAGPPSFAIALPTGSEWVSGILGAAILQVPLTILNSVIAVCALSGDLFPGRRMSSRKTALSVGLINLVTCWFGAMPVCHGSGGLAAQYRFGARTGGSVVLVGVLKIAVGAAFASTAVAVMAAYPASVLGVLLVFAALELARPAMDQTELPNFIVTLLTAVVIGLVNTIAGVAVGLVLAFTIQKRAR